MINNKHVQNQLNVAEAFAEHVASIYNTSANKYHPEYNTLDHLQKGKRNPSIWGKDTQIMNELNVTFTTEEITLSCPEQKHCTWTGHNNCVSAEPHERRKPQLTVGIY